MLFLKTKRLCPSGRHYSSLLVKFLVGGQISSTSLVSVNCKKYASEEIYPVLLRQQSIKSSTTKIANCINIVQDILCINYFYQKKSLDEVNYRSKTTVHKQLLKPLGTIIYIANTTNQKRHFQLNLSPLFKPHWCVNMYIPLFNSKSYYIIR